MGNAFCCSNGDNLDPAAQDKKTTEDKKSTENKTDAGAAKTDATPNDKGTGADTDKKTDD